jgi:hypothetical protein
MYLHTPLVFATVYKTVHLCDFIFEKHLWKYL